MRTKKSQSLYPKEKPKPTSQNFKSFRLNSGSFFVGTSRDLSCNLPLIEICSYKMGHASGIHFTLLYPNERINDF